MIRGNQNNKLQKQSNSLLRRYLSINDLKEKEYNNIELSHNARLALRNYDRYRITALNRQTTELGFQKTYLKLQALANLSPYEEFLKEDYYL